MSKPNLLNIFCKYCFHDKQTVPYTLSLSISTSKAFFISPKSFISIFLSDVLQTPLSPPFSLMLSIYHLYIRASRQRIHLLMSLMQIKMTYSIWILSYKLIKLFISLSLGLLYTIQGFLQLIKKKTFFYSNLKNIWLNHINMILQVNMQEGIFDIYLTSSN